MKVHPPRTPALGILFVLSVASGACYGAEDAVDTAASSATFGASDGASRLRRPIGDAGVSTPQDAPAPAHGIRRGDGFNRIVGQGGALWCASRRGSSETITQGDCAYTVQYSVCGWQSSDGTCICMAEVTGTEGDCDDVQIPSTVF